jgi:MFS family permease
VEAACNPLVAAIFPENKTVKLNQFHVWFPGGTVLGGLAAYGLDQAGITGWQIKLALILIPTVLYGIIFLGQQFPETERRAGRLLHRRDVARDAVQPPLPAPPRLHGDHRLARSWGRTAGCRRCSRRAASRGSSCWSTSTA